MPQVQSQSRVFRVGIMGKSLREEWILKMFGTTESPATPLQVMTYNVSLVVDGHVRKLKLFDFHPDTDLDTVDQMCDDFDCVGLFFREFNELGWVPHGVPIFKGTLEFTLSKIVRLCLENSTSLVYINVL